MEFKSFINLRGLQLPLQHPSRLTTLECSPLGLSWMENSLILQSSDCNWVLDMQVLYVMLIWRKTQFRNMGVISLAPVQAGDTGGCELKL